MTDGSSAIALLMMIGLAILLQVLLVRWLFRIDTIVKHMQYSNALMIRLLQRQGATDQELKDVLTIAEEDMKKLLNRPK